MNCPTCTALAQLLHGTTYKYIHGHELQGPKSGVPKGLKCNIQPPRAGQRFCHQCEMRNARIVLFRRTPEYGSKRVRTLFGEAWWKQLYE